MADIAGWTSEHTVSTPGRFAGWKVRRSPYTLFIDGTTPKNEPYRIYVIDTRPESKRMRDVTDLLPKLRG
jgi:hypothetical protein